MTPVTDDQCLPKFDTKESTQLLCVKAWRLSNQKSLVDESLVRVRVRKIIEMGIIFSAMKRIQINNLMYWQYSIVL